MKCIKVRIDQLGRIRDSEILVSPLMVFSGESGLGKSYTCSMVPTTLPLTASTRWKPMISAQLMFSSSLSER